MGKKRRNKHIYTKHEFISICCSKCGLCDKGATPDLCYSIFYIEHPKKFIKKIFRNLLKAKQLANEEIYSQLDGIGHNINLEPLFKKVFCTTNLCGKYSPDKQCDNIYNCVNAFRRQINGYPIVNPHDIFNKIKSKRQRRYIVQPYPAFFTNENEDFLKEIKEILSCQDNNGNNNKEQDTTKELSN